MKKRLISTSAILIFIALCIGTTSTIAHKPVTSKYTYNNHILPLFQFYCGGCHMSGGIAPMSLLTFKEAFPWAESIKEQLLADSMHPWHDDETFGVFSHSQRMTPRQLDMIVDWATGGTPEGKQTLYDLNTDVTSEWQLGEPDLVLTMDHEEVVDADMMEKTVQMVLPTALTEDRWLAAIDLKPGNPRVVHDAVIYLLSSDDQMDPISMHGVDLPAKQILGTWIPGQIYTFTEAEAAYKISAGAKLMVRMHYRKTWQDEGVVARDKSTLGLYFTEADQVIETLVFRRSGKPNIGRSRPDTLTVSQPLARDIILTSMMPQMSGYGESIQMVVENAAGETIELIKIAHFDPSWPIRYDFPEPYLVSRGSRLKITGYFNPVETSGQEKMDEHRLSVWLGFIKN